METMYKLTEEFKSMAVGLTQSRSQQPHTILRLSCNNPMPREN